MKFYITFRLDDITATMDWNKFNLLCKLFDDYQLCPLLCVVPCNKDPHLNIGSHLASFWDSMRMLKEKGWAIGQHGYTHSLCTKNRGLLRAGNWSEFAGLSYEEQCEKIKKGKLLLKEEGLNADIWIAPAHTFDYVTLQALCDNGFRYVSDGLSLFPYEERGLKFIPCQRGAPKYIFKYGLWTICIHPNHITPDDILKLKRFIVRNRFFCINYLQAIEVKSVDNIINRLPKLVFLTQLKLENFRNKWIDYLERRAQR